jgi:hypothetical protein
MVARATQVSSQRPVVESQQSGSIEQIWAQQAGSLQPGVACGTKQLPVAEEQSALITGSGDSAQAERAASTHVKSHPTAQQNSSK